MAYRRGFTDLRIAPNLRLGPWAYLPGEEPAHGVAGRYHGWISVLLGGQVFPYAEHEDYWRTSIEPLLTEGQHRFLGPLGFLRKRRLLNAARCLVSASVAPETSSLVAMEALACGTPVVAVNTGALSEIIEDGVTGFLVRNATEMAAAMRAAPQLSPEAAGMRSTALLGRCHVEPLCRAYADLVSKGRCHAA